MGLSVYDVAPQNGMRSQIRGVNVASRNAQDGVSMVQVADGALGNVGDMLQRVRDLAVQASNGTLTDAQRENLETEVQQILTEIGETAADSTVSVADLGISGLAVSTAASATAAIASLDAAISTVTTSRANLGAIQYRLERTISRLGVTLENLQAAGSRIRDADMASEMIQFTKNQILQQPGAAMLAQANQSPQRVLPLLR